MNQKPKNKGYIRKHTDSNGKVSSKVKSREQSYNVFNKKLPSISFHCDEPFVRMMSRAALNPWKKVQPKQLKFGMKLLQ